MAESTRKRGFFLSVSHTERRAIVAVTCARVSGFKRGVPFASDDSSDPEEGTVRGRERPVWKGWKKPSPRS